MKINDTVFDLQKYFSDILKSKTPEEWEENDRRVEEAEKKQRHDFCMSAFLHCGASPKYLQNVGFEKFITLNEERESNVAQTMFKNIGLQYVSKLNADIYCNMILSGIPGIGKTYLALCIAKEVCFQEKDLTQYPPEWNIKGTKKVLYRTSDYLCEEVKAAQAFNARVNKYKLIESYVDYDLMIIDEIGRTDIKQEKNTLFAVLDARHNECKSTILISNYPTDKLKREMGEALSSRMFEFSFVPAEFILNKLPNMRQKKIEKRIG